MRYGQLFILGEAWGEHEARARAPFVGPSGYELTRILDEAGISRRDCYLSNVFNLQPKDNRIEDLCGTPSIPGYGPISKGKTIKAEYAPQLNRLLSELRSVQPNLVLGVGNTAAWFLLNTTGISKIRGAVQTSPLSIRKDGLAQKCLLTYHPAAVLRQWELRPTVVSDCIKARREAAFPEVRRPRREIWIAETLEDIALFYHTYLKTAREIAFDIETSGGEITCIGFAGSHDKALVIPFFDPRKEGWSFWPFGQERTAWEWVRAILNLPAQKTAHNGVYDIHFLWRKAGMTPINYTTDTMLMHHALQPEARKALGYLGSVYTNEAAWKLMRHSNKIQERRDK